MCEPDLSGFNPECTYYVTWDDQGNEIIGDKISQLEPSDWYNYSQDEKQWANVVTINNGQLAYFVWIPRYAYKITYYTDSGKTTETTSVTQYGTIDAKMINTDDTYKNAQGEIEELAEEYQIPEGFNFYNSKLAGIWSGKYELSAGNTSTIVQGVTITTTEDSITIEKIQDASGTDTTNYQIYVNERRYIGTIPYTFENLEQNTEYRIDILSKNASGNYIHIFSKGTSTKITPPYEPDLTGFNPECTYYVTWNEAEEEEYTKITEPAPEDWYNYGQRKWANIVTIINKDTTSEKRAYFVWIPRYEYKVLGYLGITTRFITTEQTEGKGGYQIPEGFTFNGQALKGIWAGKYEVSN